MKSLKGTQTEINVLTAFSGESQARNRYDYWASKAKKDGYILVERIFTETALQEKEHAERLFKFLEGGEVVINAAFPAGIIGDSEHNLREAAAGEHYEHTQMYPSFAQIAEKEGFKEIATAMRNIAIAEAFHEKRYLELAKDIKEGRMFLREQSVTWLCQNCACPVEGKKAPTECPACAHPQAYFKVLNSTY